MKILVPIKNRMSAAAQVDAALPYCRISPSSSLVLLTVIEPVHISSPRYSFDEMAQAVETDALIRAQAFLEKTRDSLATMVPPDRVEIKVMLGRPFDEIVDAANEAAVDLVIAAQEKKHPLARRLFGSFTGRLSKKLSCPVILVKPWLGDAPEVESIRTGKPAPHKPAVQPPFHLPGSGLITRALERIRAGA